MNFQADTPMQILLADDGSAHAQAAAYLLGTLQLPPKSCIDVLCALNPRDSANSKLVQANLTRTQANLQQKGFIVHAEMSVGNPAEMILERATTTPPDLIIMGAKGLRATLGVLLGGVAQQIVEYGHWPVLVVRPGHEELRRVLVVVDGSLHSQHTVDYIQKFPLPEHVQVYLMHVLPPYIPPELLIQQMYIGPEAIPALHAQQLEKISEDRAAEEEREGKKLLLAYHEQLQAAGIEAKDVLARGDAATEIMEYALREQIDMIAAGSRGLSTVRGWLLGSVSRKLMHYAACSVLVVRGPEPSLTEDPGNPA